MSQCQTPLQASQTHPRSQCCRIPQCMHQCATHECVGAQILLELPTPQTALPVVSPQNVPQATQPWSTPVPVIHETPPAQPPVTPHIDTQPETSLPTSSTDDAPMPLSHDDDTPPWVYQEPETPWIPTHKTHQRFFHSKCRRHPNRFLRHGRSRTCPLVIQLFPPPPWFDETPPPPSTSHEDILPPVPSFDETPPLKTAPAPETPNIPSVAKHWRSGTLHLENFVSKRWRSDTLHPETPIPTTAPPQPTVACRCPACLASISKASRQTTRPCGSETASIGSSSGNVNSFGDKL